MAWTIPKTWASGDILTAFDMNAYVRDNTDFIVNTAMKKMLVNSGTYAGSAGFSGAEQTLTSQAIGDPAFPSGFYRYAAWGSFTMNANAVFPTLPDIRILYRDNVAATGSIMAESRWREPNQNRRTTLSDTGRVHGPVTGARTVFYRVVTSTADTFTINHSGISTGIGAIVVPA